MIVLTSHSVLLLSYKVTKNMGCDLLLYDIHRSALYLEPFASRYSDSPIQNPHSKGHKHNIPSEFLLIIKKVLDWPHILLFVVIRKNISYK